MNNHSIKTIVVDNYESMSETAAKIIADEINKKPELILGLATGSTPIGTYQNLIKHHNNNTLSFNQNKSFNLDEYYPLSRDHDQSYWYFMHTQFFHHIDLQQEHIHILDGQAENHQEECRSYEQRIKNHGGIDLQLLGIGNNGHIAFNEPGSAFDSRTRLIELDESTIEANSRFFNSKDEVPTQALTMGLGTILESNKIILLASGQKKAQAIKNALMEKPDPKIPASVLQHHPYCIFIIDKEAASLLG